MKEGRITVLLDDSMLRKCLNNGFLLDWSWQVYALGTDLGPTLGVFPSR